MMQLKSKLLIYAFSIWGLTSIIPASAIADQNINDKQSCAATVKIYKYACDYDVMDGYQAGMSNCLHLDNFDKRRNCLSEIKLVQHKARQQCQNVYQTRKKLCAIIGKIQFTLPIGESLASNIGVTDDL